MNAKNLINYITTYYGRENYNINLVNEILYIEINKTKITIDTNLDLFEVDKINFDRKTSQNLKLAENHSILMLIIKLLSNGYSPTMITLEKNGKLVGIPSTLICC